MSGSCQTYALSVAIRQRQMPSRVRKFLCLKPPSILSHTYCRRQRIGEERRRLLQLSLSKGAQKASLLMGAKLVPSSTNTFNPLKSILENDDIYHVTKYTKL